MMSESKMVTGVRATSLVIVMLLGSILIGCAGRAPQTGGEEPEQAAAGPGSLYVPTGVDSSVAHAALLAADGVLIGHEADSLSKLLFERAKLEKEQGQPLARLLQKGLKAPETPPDPADTLRAFETSLLADEEMRLVEDVLGRGVYQLSYGELREIRREVRQRAAGHLEAARDHLEQALEYNPWDNWSRIALLEVLEDLARLHQSLDNLDEAIEHTRILVQADRSNYFMVLQLADRYLLRGDSLKALENYRRAEDLLLTWARFPRADAEQTGQLKRSLDSLEYADWLIAVREQMYLEQDLYLGPDMVRDATRLVHMAREEVPADSQFASAARALLEWIAWDEGNIHTAAERIPIIDLINEGQHELARQRIAGIRDQLRAEQAKVEMDTLAALLDFGYLDEPEAALGRLKNMLRRHGFSEVDSSLDTLLLREGREPFARKLREQYLDLDEQWRGILNLYGSFCVVYANQLERHDRTREKAFVYYYQAALVPHKDQRFALMALANMSVQRPRKVVLYGEAALTSQLVGELAPLDRRTVYGLLVDAYRSLNDLNRAQHYFMKLSESGS